MMHSKPTTRSYGFALAIMSVIAMAAAWPQAAQALPPSTDCPPVTITVTRGGVVQMDAACTSGGFGSGSNVPVDLPAHGIATIVERGNIIDPTIITYQHTDVGNPATTDSFTYDDGALHEALVNVIIEDATGPLPLNIDPNDLPTIFAGAPYSQQLSASGGTGTITYALKSGTLPVGISLSAGGLIFGTTTSRFDVTFTIEATDSTGLTGEITYSEDVEGDTLTLSPNPPPAAAINHPYSVTFSSGGGVAPRTVVLASGSLPPGLSLGGSNGHTLSGTPTALGNYTFQLNVEDSSGGFGTQFTAHTVTLDINAQPTITVTPATLPDGTVGTAYSQAVSGSGGTAPYTFSVSAGSVPDGLNLNANTGAISGTPTEGGASAFTITATDANNFSGQRAYAPNFAAPTIVLGPASLPGGTTSTAYSETLTASGGVASYAFAVSAGSLPTGLNLDAATGQISGTPSVAASFNFDITVTDSTTGSGPYTDVASYTIVIASSAPPVANLSISKSDASGSYIPGGSATYVITVRNAGPDAVAGAIVNDVLPNGVTLRFPWSCSATAGTCTPTSGGSTGDQTVTLAVDLDAGGQAQISVQINFDDDPASYP